MKESLGLLLTRIYQERFKGEEQGWRLEDRQGVPCLALHSPCDAAKTGISEMIYYRVKDSHNDRIFYESANSNGTRNPLRCYTCGTPAVFEQRTITVEEGGLRDEESIAVDEERSVPYPRCPDRDCIID